MGPLDKKSIPLLAGCRSRHKLRIQMFLLNGTGREIVGQLRTDRAHGSVEGLL